METMIDFLFVVGLYALACVHCCHVIMTLHYKGRMFWNIPEMVNCVICRLRLGPVMDYTAGLHIKYNACHLKT